MNDYVSVIYDDKRVPKTNYPFALAEYLFNRYQMSKNIKLLEIGCGRGEFLDAFEKLGVDCYGVDLSDYCLKNQPHLKVKCVDLSNKPLPFEDGFFDVVYHKSVLEHFFSPDKIMKETLRVLKPGGRLIVLTPDWKSQMEIFYEDFTHCRPYDMTSLSDLLRIYGFADIQSELFRQLPIIWRFSYLKALSGFLRLIISTPRARKLTRITNIQFFRWSVELMVLGTGIKKEQSLGVNHE